MDRLLTWHQGANWAQQPVNHGHYYYSGLRGDGSVNGLNDGGAFISISASNASADFLGGGATTIWNECFDALK